MVTGLVIAQNVLKVEFWNKFGNIYDLDKFDAAIGSTIYSVERTITAFARVYKSFSNKASIAVCISIHDQDPSIRIKE